VIEKLCITCDKEFKAKRKDKKFCSRLCYRRNPNVAKKYSDRTNKYQRKIATEPWRRFQKLQFKCSHKDIYISLREDNYTKLISSGCFYCKKDISKETGCGLDRLDNNGGYELTNVVPCCGSCNQIRNKHLTHDEMRVAMDAVLTYRNKYETRT
jgi:hypothetical protein